MTWIEVGIGAGALVASALIGSVLLSWALRVMAPQAPKTGVLRGGMWIGILERLAITTAIVVGYGEAVAVVIAIKGLGRYPEMRRSDREDGGAVAERFIIGTLASFLWAAAVGLAALALLARFD